MSDKDKKDGVAGVVNQSVEDVTVQRSGGTHGTAKIKALRSNSGKKPYTFQTFQGKA